MILKWRQEEIFQTQFGTDNKAVILNETAVKLLGFENAADAVNQKLRHNGDTVTIVGVTSNFHQLGLQKTIDPMIIVPRLGTTNFYSLKVNQANMQQSIAALKQTWSTYFPKDPFDYYFLDESFGQQYQADILFGKVFGVFAFLAILIACFGLLGLSAYNVLQRTKEIGVRKVIGCITAKHISSFIPGFFKACFYFIVACHTCWLVYNV